MRSGCGQECDSMWVVRYEICAHTYSFQKRASFVYEYLSKWPIIFLPLFLSRRSSIAVLNHFHLILMTLYLLYCLYESFGYSSFKRSQLLHLTPHSSGHDCICTGLYCWALISLQVQKASKHLLPGTIKYYGTLEIASAIVPLLIFRSLLPK